MRKPPAYISPAPSEPGPQPDREHDHDSPQAQTPPESPRSSCRGCSLWDEVKERVRITELLESAIEKMGERLRSEDFKPSIADYLKLMQLEKELNQDQVKEIRVTWVSPAPLSEPGK